MSDCSHAAPATPTAVSGPCASEDPGGCRPIRLPMFAPHCRRGSVGKQFLLDLRVVPILRQRPWHARRLRGGYVLMDGALRNRTTAGDLMLAQPEEWSRRTSFNLRMVSLFCGNWESPLLSGVQDRKS